jgi:hypothetical protein
LPLLPPACSKLDINRSVRGGVLIYCAADTVMEDFIGVYIGNLDTSVTKAIDRNNIVLYGFDFGQAELNICYKIRG